MTPERPEVAGLRPQAGRHLLGAINQVAHVVADRTELSASDRETGPLDLMLGSAIAVAEAASRAAGALIRGMGPLAGVVLRPPLVSPRLHPERLVRELSARGRAERVAAAQDAETLTRSLVPWVVSAVLDQLDLTAIVLDRVDLDAVAAQLDLPAIIARVDVDAIVGQADLDAIIARLDLNRIAEGIDVDAIVGRADLNAIITRLDLNRIAEGIDVDTIVARVDLDAIVDRLDVLGLAMWVVDNIDLPEIIRESTGSVSSEAIRGVRMQSVEADVLVGRVIDRLLLRRRARRLDVPGVTAVNGLAAHEREPRAGDGGENGE
ncbi:MAG: hypothetical protein ABI934_01645 [Actinomycetota bacterium]